MEVSRILSWQNNFLFNFFFRYDVHRLEILVKSLQAKGASSIITENGNNVVTITTAHSSTRMNNESGGQHQDIATKPQRATQIKMIPTSNAIKTSTSNGNGTGNVSGGSGGSGGGTSSTILSGPVTDL